MRYTPDQIWLKILSELGDTIREDVYLRQAKPMALTESELTVSVPSVYTQEQIASRFLPDINGLLEKQIGANCRLKIIAAQPDGKRHPEPSVSSTPATAPDDTDAPSTDTTLNPEYSFDRFVVGTGNRLSHAASLAVSENPGKIYNPLFIYGGVGLGKTHLLHAIGNRIQEVHSKQKVLYISSETFMNEYIDSIITRTTAFDFRSKYRTVDVLLIDDIQFLQRKEGTQEEFFHTFNELHQNSNHIVMTSDRPPKNLETVEERLRSRFEWGMVADISPPQFETRIAILRQKCEDQNLENVPDSVLSYIAEVIQTNIRDLEGSLIRVAAEASLFNEELTVDFARNVLNDFAAPPPRINAKAITAEDIQKAVAGYFRIKISDLKSSTRTKAIVVPRQIAMYLCRQLTNLSLMEIADAFGRQDHTTILHANNRIEERIRTDAELYQTINFLIEDIK
ncbi:chromosomal replication initiator protein DnaA [Candidatus Poribacteria bacterium]|nr:MAG: chromosomal replication initiator protein DnaA [Candidatus Poribacteria bacterium]